MSLPWHVTVDGRWDQRAIQERCSASWAEEPLRLPVAVSVSFHEQRPVSGTRTRVHPTGEPSLRTVLGRVERALVESGVLSSADQVVAWRSIKRWSIADGLSIEVGHP